MRRKALLSCILELQLILLSLLVGKAFRPCLFETRQSSSPRHAPSRRPTPFQPEGWWRQQGQNDVFVREASTSPDPASTPILATHHIPPEVTTLPLPAALHSLFPTDYPSMSKARKLIRRDQVFVNGEVKSCQDSVQGGDVITLRELVHRGPARKEQWGSAKVKSIKVVYEDEHLGVIIKPAGMLVHGHGNSSLMDRYTEVLAPSTASQEDILPKPVHVHRLDGPVGGLLIVAKTRPALLGLHRDFADRAVEKRYRAVLLGMLEGEGRITEPVEEKNASTYYKSISVTPSPSYGALTSVDLYPETGRKHQLRVHMACMGTPILGDLRYGPDGDNQLKTRGLFLFAIGLKFRHPIDGREMTLSIAEPEIFMNTIRMEFNRQKAAEEEAAAAR